jgi:tetratricopeptide (TPR) repeat protein
MRLQILFGVLLCSSVAAASNYQLQTLSEAHRMFRAATNATMYTETAQQYEYLVSEDGVRNGQLYYTLGNTYFLAGDLGRAVLNYRRAEQYLPNNSDVQHNLAAALEQRADLIPAQDRHPFAARLLGWHYNTSPPVRWWLFATCWLAAWGGWIWKRRTEKKEARITLLAGGILSIVFIVSLTVELMLTRNTEPGVILAAEVLARKGDGEIYAPAFLDPLHSGTEFLRLEARDKWWHIRLADGQECWIPSLAAETVTR